MASYEWYRLRCAIDVSNSVQENVEIFWGWWDRSYGMRNRLRFALQVLTELVDEDTPNRMAIVEAIATSKKAEDALLLDDSETGSVDALELSLFANGVNALVWGQMMADGKIDRPPAVPFSDQYVSEITRRNKRDREGGEEEIFGEQRSQPPPPVPSTGVDISDSTPLTQPAAKMEEREEEEEEESSEEDDDEA